MKTKISFFMFNYLSMNKKKIDIFKHVKKQKNE